MSKTDERDAAIERVAKLQALIIELEAAGFVGAILDNEREIAYLRSKWRL